MARGPSKRFLIAVLMAIALPHAASAAWQDDHRALRVGFLSTSGAAYDMLRLEPFRAYLQSWLSLPVELVPATSYAALIDAQATDRVQYAIHSATSFATANARCHCIEPLALPAAYDGARGFYSVLLARADGPIRALADAKGTRLALSAEDSIAGRLVPLKYLQREGIEPDTDFSAIVTKDDPEAAVGALLSGDADVAAAWSSLTGDPSAGYDFGVLTAMVAEGTLVMDGVRVVWQSPLIPFGPHALRNDVPSDIKDQIAAALTAMAANAPNALDAVDRSSVGGGGFVPVEAREYAVIDALIGAESAGDGGAVEP